MICLGDAGKYKWFQSGLSLLMFFLFRLLYYYLLFAVPPVAAIYGGPYIAVSILLLVVFK